MRRFAGHKSHGAIKKQCKALGIDFNDLLHKTGGDWVVVTSIEGDNYSGQVLYNTANGNFFGTTPDGVQFDSTKTTHDRNPWFQALLAFFHE